MDLFDWEAKLRPLELELQESVLPQLTADIVALASFEEQQDHAKLGIGGGEGLSLSLLE